MAGEQVVRCTEGLIYYTGYSVPVLIALVVGILMTFLATRTMFGRYVYAIGGNPEAAELAGINTKWMTVKVFALMGALVGVSSIISSARLNAATNALGRPERILRDCGHGHWRHVPGGRRRHHLWRHDGGTADAVDYFGHVAAEPRLRHSRISLSAWCSSSPYISTNSIAAASSKGRQHGKSAKKDPKTPAN